METEEATSVGPRGTLRLPQQTSISKLVGVGTERVFGAERFGAKRVRACTSIAAERRLEF